MGEVNGVDEIDGNSIGNVSSAEALLERWVQDGGKVVLKSTE
jgi:hypothetical protein